MATQRGPFTRCTKIGLGGDGILIIAEVISGIGQYLHQGDAGIRCVTFLPFRHGDAKPIQHEAPEAGVVLRQIIELRRCLRCRFTQWRPWTVEVTGTVDLERKIHPVENRIKIGRWTGGVIGIHQQQVIGGRGITRRSLEAAEDCIPNIEDLVLKEQGKIVFIGNGFCTLPLSFAKARYEAQSPADITVVDLFDYTDAETDLRMLENKFAEAKIDFPFYWETIGAIDLADGIMSFVW